MYDAAAFADYSGAHINLSLIHIYGFFDFLAWGADATSDEIRGLQSGRIQQYTFVFLLGTLALILLLLL